MSLVNRPKQSFHMPINRKSIKFCALGQKDESASCSDDGKEDGTEEGKERACDTLLLCLITTMNQGLRNGGGIGDVLRPPSMHEPFFLPRVLYDMLFFFILIIVLLLFK